MTVLCPRRPLYTVSCRGCQVSEHAAPLQKTDERSDAPVKTSADAIGLRLSKKALRVSGGVLSRQFSGEIHDVGQVPVSTGILRSVKL